MTRCIDALKAYETETGIPIPEMEEVKLIGILPPIEKMDGSLGKLANCRKLSLSTNAIERIGSLQGLHSLQILSLGRNQLKRLEPFDAVASTLTELWISFNQIERLSGLSACHNLRVLYIAVNRIANISEIQKLADLSSLEVLDLRGNPITEMPNYRLEVIARLPHLQILDGIPVSYDERQATDGS